MILKYLPNKELFIDGISIAFSEFRNDIRKKLRRAFREENHSIPKANPNDDPMLMRRDIYNFENSKESFFFLNYDHEDLLIEMEVHRCEKIEVFDISFDFEDDLDNVALELSKYSEVDILSQGEILFKDLKMVLSDRRKMGSEGNEISYMYCSSDISHLM